MDMAKGDGEAGGDKEVEEKDKLGEKINYNYKRTKTRE